MAQPEPKIPAVVAHLVARLLEGQQRALALYLFGSAATGTFESELSDVDTVAVLSTDLTEKNFSALTAMHDALIRVSPEWNDRVEVVYLSGRGLGSFREGSAPAARISPGEPFHRIEVDGRWVLDWYAVREWGLTLFGPPPATFIPAIPQREVVAAVREELRRWPGRIAGLSDGGAQAYAVLTVCRGWHLCRTSEHVSKREAAQWAASELPQFADLIQNAAAWRERSRAGAFIDVPPTRDDTRRFVEIVAEMVA